jgi:hypothetical protein
MHIKENKCKQRWRFKKYLHNILLWV